MSAAETTRCDTCGSRGPHKIMATDSGDYVVATCAACGERFGVELHDGQWLNVDEVQKYHEETSSGDRMLQVGDVLTEDTPTVSIPCPVGCGHTIDAPTMATVVALPEPGEKASEKHLRVEIDRVRLHALVDAHVEANYRTHIVDRLLGGEL